MDNLKDDALNEIREMAEKELSVLKGFAHDAYLEGRAPLVRDENQVVQAYLRGLIMYLGKKGYRLVKK